VKLSCQQIPFALIYNLAIFEKTPFSEERLLAYVKLGILIVIAAGLLGAFCGFPAPRDSQSGGGSLAQADSVPGWPRQVRRVEIESSFDSTRQPALFWAPEQAVKPVPLLVTLHTWSGDYLQNSSLPYLEQARRHGWVFIHPDFRGPNDNPRATGSLAATSDILDAVAYAEANSPVDTSRIYLVGTSGGGHMALLTAGRNPQLWAGVSAWVPITDLARWYGECLQRQLKYAAEIEASCGGPPDQSEQIRSSYEQRSPVSVLAGAAGLAVEICAGIHDGHTGSVPLGHTLRGFNILARANGHKEKLLTDRQIDWFERQKSVPVGLAGELEDDPDYGERKVLFRRAAGPVRVTVFEGGHEGIAEAAVNWLARQRKN
jgi:dienelactone hydrolase